MRDSADDGVESSQAQDVRRELNGLAKSIRDSLIQAVITFQGQRSRGGKPADETAYVLRDSLTYRVGAVRYHLHLLQDQLEFVHRKSNSELTKMWHDHMFMENMRTVLTYLADDLLFNVISMFDYLGNVVGYLHAGERALKWNGVVRAARDKNHAISSTAAGNAAKTCDGEWVGRLHKVRSEIIHNERRLGDGGRTLTFGDAGPHVAVSFEMPSAIVTKLLFLRDRAPDGRVQLVPGMELITVKALEAANRVSTALSDDLAKKTASGS